MYWSRWLKMMSNDERDGCIKSKWLSGALHMGLIVESMSGMFSKVGIL